MARKRAARCRGAEHGVAEIPLSLDVVRAAEVPRRARGRQKATTHGVDVIELKDGKIARMTSYANGRLDALIAEPSG